MGADLEVRSSLHPGRPLHADMYARTGILRPAQPATGAAAAAATPRLNNAPTFGVFVDQVIDFVITQGSASPSSVGGPSSASLSSSGTSVTTLRHVAEVACFERNAINLNLRYEP